MEVQVDFLESDVALKLVLICFLFFHDGFRTGCKLFILTARPICTYLLEPHTLFVKAQHVYPYYFSIAKGLTTCRLGGVISAQKVLF